MQLAWTTEKEPIIKKKKSTSNVDGVYFGEVK